jgi:hypothetical protein
MTWLYGSFTNKEILDFWIYRYIRHPQYLGLLIINWYHVFQCTLFAHLWFPITPPSTFFLITGLFIIGIAIHEENQLINSQMNEFLNYRNRTSFMIPLPHILKAYLIKLNDKIIKKEWPETDREILVLLAFYGFLLILVSVQLILLHPVEFGDLR